MRQQQIAKELDHSKWDTPASSSWPCSWSASQLHDCQQTGAGWGKSVLLHGESPYILPMVPSVIIRLMAASRTPSGRSWQLKDKQTRELACCDWAGWRLRATVYGPIFFWQTANLWSLPSKVETSCSPKSDPKRSILIQLQIPLLRPNAGSFWWVSALVHQCLQRSAIFKEDILYWVVVQAQTKGPRQSPKVKAQKQFEVDSVLNKQDKQPSIGRQATEYQVRSFALCLARVSS